MVCSGLDGISLFEISTLSSCSYLHYIAQIKACTISDVFQLSRFADSLSFSTSVDNFVAGKGSDAGPPNIGVKPGSPFAMASLYAFLSTHPPKISQYLWIPRQIKWYKHLHRRQGEHAHDICGYELISSQPRRMFQPRIKQLEHISKSRIHIFNDWVICG